MKKISQAQFEKHLEKEHSLSAVSAYLKEIVYGGVDGIVTTFAVVAGFAGAQSSEGMVAVSSIAVLLFGLANLFADAASMGLGNILSLRADQDVYRRERRKEIQEIRSNKSFEIAETVRILKNKGFSSSDAETMAKLYSKNEKFWADFMMEYELEMGNPENENPLLTGLATFLAFILFGSIPLLPYIVLGTGSDIFLIASASTFVALILLGVLRWRTTRESVLRSIGEIVLLGGTSAVIAYLVGTFFRS